MTSKEPKTIRRVNITLDIKIYNELKKRAKAQGRQPGNLAAWLLTEMLKGG